MSKIYKITEEAQKQFETSNTKVHLLKYTDTWNGQINE
jgi:hypothetical protein